MINECNRCYANHRDSRVPLGYDLPMHSAYSIAAAKRIAHVRAHLEGGFANLDQAVSNIENNTGSPKGSAMNLARHAEAKAISCWFENSDLGPCGSGFM